MTVKAKHALHIPFILLFKGRDVISLRIRTLIGTVACLTSVGCASTFTTAPIAPLPAGDVNAIGYNADIDVGPVVTGQATATRALVIFKSYPKKMAGDFTPGVFGLDMISRAKAGAVYNALAQSGGDVLIAPRYEVTETKSLLSHTVVVTVRGYRGTVKSVVKRPGDE